MGHEIFTRCVKPAEDKISCET